MGSTAVAKIAKPLVFVDVDTQRDFLDRDGALYLPGSELIRPNLGMLTQLAWKCAIPVIATGCAHTLYEEDPEPFPPHCLVGTTGQGRIDETRWPGEDVAVLGAGAGLDLRGFETPRPYLLLEKQRYDVFSQPIAEVVFKRYSEGLSGPIFVVYGVATDYCVACVARGLLERGHGVAVVSDAIYPVRLEAEPRILTELADLGAVLTNSEVVESVARG